MSSKSLARNSAIQILGKIIGMGVATATFPLMTRALGTTGYGKFTIALTFLSFFAILVDFGLTLTTTQMISEQPQKEGVILGNLLTLRIVSSILFLSLAPLLVLAFPYANDVKIAVAIGALSYFFGSTAQMLVGVFQTRLVMRYPIAAELANRILVLLGVLILTKTGGSLLGMIWLFTFGNGLQLIINLLAAHRFIPLKLRFSLDTWKEILRRSWPIGTSIFFNLLYLKGDILALSLYATEQVNGLYGSAYKVVDILMAFPVMYMGLILPVLVRHWTKGEKKEFEQLLQHTFDAFSYTAIPIAFGCFATGIPVMRLVAGDAFAESGNVLMILGLAITAGFFGALSGHTIVAIQKQRLMLFGYVLVAALIVPAYFYFIPRFGMYAAAWVTVTSEIGIWLLTSFVVWRTTRFFPRLTLFWKSLVGSALMAGSLFLLPSMPALISVGVGIVLFVVLVSILGGPTPRELAKLFV